MAATPEKVTDEQATAAIQQLTGINPADGSVVEEPEAETQAAEPAEAEPAEAPDDAPETEEPAAAAAETDDVQSLKKRLDTIEAERKADKEKSEERLRAIQERHAANERILRDRHLRKSSSADKALRILKQWKQQPEVGVPEVEVDRVIADLQGTMNPDSTSYAPPPESRQMASEDQIVTLNQFLNENSMTGAEEIAFGKWLKYEAEKVMPQSEQEVAQESLKAFLPLAHARWQKVLHETQQTQQKQQADAAAAVKAAQRTQRAAARAATASPSAPSKSSGAAPKPVDLKKLTKDQISRLMIEASEEAVRGNY